MSILSDRLQDQFIKRNLICKEQARFISKQECIAQAMTLYEILFKTRIDDAANYAFPFSISIINAFSISTITTNAFSISISISSFTTTMTDNGNASQESNTHVCFIDL